VSGDRAARAAALLVLAIVLAAALARGDAAVLAQQPAESPTEAALRLVRERTGLPADRLSVASSAAVAYPWLGTASFAVKVLDAEAGVVHSVTLDPAGQPVEASRLVAGERAARRAQEGALEPALAQRLARSSTDDAVDVIIWLKEPPASAPSPRREPSADGRAPTTPGDVRAAHTATSARRAAAVQRLASPVVDRLSQLGLSANRVWAAPALYARLPAQWIRAVATWTEVDRVYLARRSTPDLESARPTVHADVVQARGITGAGVPVAQLEIGGRLSASNPYLAGVLQDQTFVCDSESAHGTMVAGVLRSTHPTIRGIAPAITLWAGGSCSGDPAELHDRAAAAAAWGAQVFNLSLSNDTDRTPTGDDRFYDDLVFNLHRVVVKSAGNLGLGTGDVTSPGLGYNVLSVGNFDDRNTPDWADDGMNTTSSFLPPLSTHGDRQKPELVAVGTNITSTSLTPPWVDGNSTGSSFAAPMVSGAAALLLQRNPDLGLWPEAVRAILMATAVHNLDGDPRLSARDGAGGLVADRADDVARGVTGAWGARAYDCASPSPLDVATLPLTAGQRVRAALAWNSDPGGSEWPSQPGADLDLIVIGPKGTSVAVSTSFDNSYEIVDFIVGSDGTHLLRVSRTRCDASPQGVAWAWHVVSTPAVAASPACTPTRPNVSVTSTRVGSGRLQVTVTAQTLPGGATNTLRTLRFGDPHPSTNELIDMSGQTARSGAFSLTLPAGTTSTSFVVRQAATGRPTTVNLVVVDGCGDWPTMVGGGTGAF
jgi:hypothetical protein